MYECRHISGPLTTVCTPVDTVLSLAGIEMSVRTSTLLHSIHVLAV